MIFDFIKKFKKKKKMSKIALEMAKTLFKQPRAFASPEAQNASLLFVHIAWNLAQGVEDEGLSYEPMIKMLEKSNPDFWNEFKYDDPKKLIGLLAEYKKIKYPEDDRIIVSCEMHGENVRAEWKKPSKLKT